MKKISPIITEKIHEYRGSDSWSDYNISTFCRSEKPFGKFCVALYTSNTTDHIIGRYTFRHFYMINLKMRQITESINKKHNKNYHSILK